MRVCLCVFLDSLVLSRGAGRERREKGRCEKKLKKQNATGGPLRDVGIALSTAFWAI